MKKSTYLAIFIYSCLILGIITQVILNAFGFNWSSSFQNLEKLQQFILSTFLLTISLALMMVLLIKIVEMISLARVKENLQRLVDGASIVSENDDELDRLFHQTEDKMKGLTESLQKSQNQTLQTEEEVIQKERRRIARDLHDTVSQEIFAANMILSGVSKQIDRLEPEALGRQLKGVGDILDTAQRDLRILLLHLRPTELEGRSLVQGMQGILKELAEKSDIQVRFQQNVSHLPKQIEEHIFRIAQEIISNTLRHAKASSLEVYLYQTEHELQLKMSDDGVGFDRATTNDLSYGLKNIKERVHDMAGSIKILTAPKKGVAIDIRIPLLEE